MTRAYKKFFVTAIYKDIEYEKSLTDWRKFLSDKPIYEHITTNTMRCRIRSEREMTTRQVLGIDKLPQKGCSGKNKVPMVHKNELKTYDMRNEFLRRSLACVLNQ